MNEIFTERLSEIDYKFYILRQVVERAKEAKRMGWTINSIAPEYRATSPGELYEYLIGYADLLINEIEELLNENRS